MSQVTSKYVSGDLIHHRYKVVRLIGQGGMAEVYLVEDIEMHNQQIALKLLYPHISLDDVNVERFIREVELTRRHNHPNIVRSYHYGKTERNEQYFTMEYVEGKSLGQLLSEKGSVNYQLVYHYLLQIASALSAAHKAGIIHRDIKPDNLILTNDGVVKVSDFGIAKDLNSSVKLTEQEKGPKSYAYKAPELYVEEYDHKVDIYSLGITTYELLTGQLPFTGERHQLLVAHLKTPVPEFAGKQSGIPSWFQEFVNIATAKKAKDRFQSCEEIIGFLKGHTEDISDRSSVGNDSGGSQGSEDNWNIRIKKNKVISFIRATTSKYLISLIVGILVFLLFTPVFPRTDGKGRDSLIGEVFDLHLIDLFFKIRGPIAPPKDILIIRIDESSYDKLGVSTLRPWPREKTVQLLENLKDKNPKKIIFDYVFPEIKDPSVADREIDLKLAKAMQYNPTYIAKFLNKDMAAESTPDNNQSIWIESDELFSKSVRGTFPALVVNSKVVRRFYFSNLHDGSSGNESSLPIADLLYDNKQGNRLVPRYQDLINYYGSNGSIKSIPVYRVLDGDYEVDYFKDKIVFVGLHLSLGYELKLRDTFATPYSPNTAGVEIHATTLGNLIDKNWIRRLTPFHEGVLLSLTAILTSYFILSIKPSYSLIVIILSWISWIFTAYLLFSNYLFFPGLLVLIVAMPLAYILSIFKVYKDKKESDRILGIENL